MKFVTTALDKSIKTAFMGIGYGITMVGNAINLSGNKFHGHGGKRIHSAHTAREAQFAQQKQTLEAEKTSAQQQLIAEQTTLTNLATNRGISDATHQDFINVLSLQQKIKTDTQKRDDIVARYPDLDTDITNYQTWLQNNQNNPQARAVREELNQFLQIQIQRDQLNQDITTNEGTLRQMQNNNQYLNVPDLATLATIVSEFDNAKANVQFLTDQINERDAKLNTWDADHKNKFVELMAYWDMLETGRNTHMGKMYNWKPIKAGNAQKKFDGQKQTIISDYLSGYSYAA
jgi:DNA repair exonuclease SbcCD ATPase subunit